MSLVSAVTKSLAPKAVCAAAKALRNSALSSICGASSLPFLPFFSVRWAKAPSTGSASETAVVPASASIRAMLKREMRRMLSSELKHGKARAADHVSAFGGRLMKPSLMTLAGTDNDLCGSYPKSRWWRTRGAES
ncbi:MAG: hypothetical protein Q27BB25_03400 [Blastomonas sp. CACIA14H2]|nr:MAG: hypothetical protein Q27BB25_03400 [Blastomonas sp. CACIA14H2]